MPRGHRKRAAKDLWKKLAETHLLSKAAAAFDIQPEVSADKADEFVEDVIN